MRTPGRGIFLFALLFGGVPLFLFLAIRSTTDASQKQSWSSTSTRSASAPPLERLREQGPAFTLEALDTRLRLIFEELQKAWAAQDLSGVRPYVSAGLLQHLDYWVTAYRSQGLRNEVKGATLERSELVRVVRDAHYDSLTLRVWACGKDFTVRVDTEEVVGGSRREDRRYTEYWTLIRGAKVRGALVTAGDFDWILSRIEQDESYT